MATILGIVQKTVGLPPLPYRHLPSTPISDLEIGCDGYVTCDTHFGYCTAGKYKGCECGVGIGKMVRALDTDVANDNCGTTVGDCNRDGRPVLHYLHKYQLINLLIFKQAAQAIPFPAATSGSVQLVNIKVVSVLSKTLSSHSISLLEWKRSDRRGNLYRDLAQS